jgi:hypothetical protein
MNEIYFSENSSAENPLNNNPDNKKYSVYVTKENIDSVLENQRDYFNRNNPSYK